MVGIDMQVLFEDKIGELMTNVKKLLSSTEEERLLNEAQLRFVEAQANLFEVTEDSRRSLAPITKYASVVPVTPAGFIPVSDYSVVFDYTDGLTQKPLRIVEEQAITNASARITIKPITHDRYLANVENPYKKPYGKLVWRLDTGKYIELIPDSTLTISKYEYRYIEQPVDIDFSSSTVLSLNDEDLYKVADIAVELALQALSLGRAKEA